MVNKHWQLSLSAAELSALLEYGDCKDSEWSIELIREALDIPHAAAGSMAAGVLSLQEKELILLTSFGTLDKENSSLSWFFPYLWDIQDALSFVMLGEGRKMTGVALRAEGKEHPAYIFAAGGGMFSSVTAVTPLELNSFGNYGNLASSVYEQFIQLLDAPEDGFAMAMTYHSPETIALVNARYLPETGWDASVSGPDYTLSPDMQALDIGSFAQLGKVLHDGPFKAFSLE